MCSAIDRRSPRGAFARRADGARALWAEGSVPCIRDRYRRTSFPTDRGLSSHGSPLPLQRPPIGDVVRVSVCDDVPTRSLFAVLAAFQRSHASELSLGLLVTHISPWKREGMMSPHRTTPRLVNFQGAVGSEGGHGQALRRPRRSMPAATVAKTRGSLPSGAGDIGHMPPPLDQARARRDLRSLSSHAAPCRR
jgi:hypothetical protein